MKPLLLLLSIALASLVSGCGFYTLDHECAPASEEASEIEGDLVGVSVDDEGEVHTTKTRDATFTAAERIELHVGPMLTFRSPPGPGTHRLEDLDARLCVQDCIDLRGTLDVVVWEADGIDATVHPEEGPVAADRPALRGSARLLFRRWQKEVCHSERKGSNSAFAIKY